MAKAETKTETKAEIFEAKNAEWVKAPDHRNFYANNIGVATSTHDIQLRFSQLTAEGSKPINLEVATLFMSPSHAKATAILLIRSVAEYEKKHKLSLPLPDHLAKLVDEVEE